MGLGGYVAAGICGVVVAIFVFFILYVMIFSRIAEEHTIVNHILAILSIALALAGGVFSYLGVKSWCKSDIPVHIELVDGQSYDKEDATVKNIKDTSSDRHPNRFSVEFTDGKVLEIPRSKVKFIKFYDGSELNIDSD